MNRAPAALADIPLTVGVPCGVPALADRAYDSDPLRERPDRDGFELLARHRANRTEPPANGGRKLRRWKRRRVVERTFGWVEAFRRVATRSERKCDLYDGFVSLACALIALSRL